MSGKSAGKSALIIGVGHKTVLLNEIERQAKTDGYFTIVIEAPENKPPGPLLFSTGLRHSVGSAIYPAVHSGSPTPRCLSGERRYVDDGAAVWL